MHGEQRNGAEKGIAVAFVALLVNRRRRCPDRPPSLPFAIARAGLSGESNPWIVGGHRQWGIDTYGIAFTGDIPVRETRTKEVHEVCTVNFSAPPNSSVNASRLYDLFAAYINLTSDQYVLRAENAFCFFTFLFATGKSGAKQVRRSLSTESCAIADVCPIRRT